MMKVLRSDLVHPLARPVNASWRSLVLTSLVLPSVFLVGWLTGNALGQTSATPLQGTKQLVDLPEDPAAAMVAGIDRFASQHLVQIAADRQRQYWSRSGSLPDNAEFVRERLGLPYLRPTETGNASQVVADRTASESVQQPGWMSEPKLLLSDEVGSINRIRWPAIQHPAPQLSSLTTVWGEGLLLAPREPNDILIIVVPDASETPEELVGLSLPKPDTEQAVGDKNRAERHDGRSGRAEMIRSLAAAGCTVVVMATVDRELMQHGNAELTRREYLHRAAFELGVTVAGYELAMLQSLLDHRQHATNVVVGYGEGGRLALFAAALEPRVDHSIVCGYFGPRDASWQEPLDRNTFGLFDRAADAELAILAAPRTLWVDSQPQYQLQLQTRGGAPSQWTSPTPEQVQAELLRIGRICEGLGIASTFATALEQPLASPAGVGRLFEALDLEPVAPWSGWESSMSVEVRQEIAEATETRTQRLVASIDAHNQAILEECDYQRAKYLNIGLNRDDVADKSNSVDTESLKQYEQSIERYREAFAVDVIGRFDQPLLDANPRSRQKFSGRGWTGYEVVLDVVSDVMAYGVLLVPDDLQAGEQRPVVVCQHGLEGRPEDTLQGDHRAYHDFAAHLAERGFVVFAPQNPYIGEDRFRVLQRKLNPAGKTLFSVIALQHQQLLDWLSTLDFVDPERIGFYGLSYGGKSAMRLPALLPQYCLSICSADFNDWVWKNASSRAPYSYVGTGEYEIFEFDLGHRFNYAEMAALIAPRPFMVERGHFDGVAPDDRVAKEFARVRFLYAARLNIPERCQIEWFNGPHTIHGQATFDFLHQHLNWPKP